MKKIHFIINPIAGKGNNTIDTEVIARYFSSEVYDITLKYSTYKKEAVTLTQNSVTEGATVIVACGGDGTINEVASVLVHTNVVLGIIPIGSGNGLASHLNIPKNIEAALCKIKEQKTTRIDVGCCSGEYFFSNLGLGLTANVIKNYERYTTRTFSCYLKAAIKALLSTQNKNPVGITINDTQHYKNPVLIFVSNSNELGYHFSLTPQASLQDGLLDVLIIPQMHKLRLAGLSILWIVKKHLSTKRVVHYQTRSLQLTRNSGTFFEYQMDGEYKKVLDTELLIELLKASLTVIQ